MTDGYIGVFQRPLYPDPVAGVSFNEVGDLLEVTWDIVPSGVSSDYEVWSSVGDQNNYDLIAIVNNMEIASGEESVTVVDESYDASTIIYYKLFHKSVGYYSDPLESGIALTYSVPDPTNLDVAVGLNQIALSWTNDTSRLLKSVKVTHDANEVEGNLSEGSSVEVFNGTAGGFTYEVLAADITKWHQFWISSITKT